MDDEIFKSFIVAIDLKISLDDLTFYPANWRSTVVLDNDKYAMLVQKLRMYYFKNILNADSEADSEADSKSKKMESFCGFLTSISRIFVKEDGSFVTPKGMLRDIQGVQLEKILSL